MFEKRSFTVRYSARLKKYSVITIGPRGGRGAVVDHVTAEELAQKYKKCDYCSTDSVDVYHRSRDFRVFTFEELNNAPGLQYYHFSPNFPDGEHCVMYMTRRFGIWVCDKCGEIIVANRYANTLVSDTDEILCSTCRNEEIRSKRLFRCERCHQHFRNRELLIESDGELYDDNCFDIIKCPINGYHTMKRGNNFSFHKMPDEENPLYMGYELEVDSRSIKHKKVNKTSIGLALKFGDFFRYEHDGSLSRGFEIISEPASLNYHLNQDLDFLTNTCISAGLRSHDVGSCGLHVHLDKNFFGANEDEQDENTAKLLFLFDKFWHSLWKFSRRTSTRWCARYTQLPETVVKNKQYLGRYYAVNLTNPKTIEIRLWRGTLNLVTLKATLKLTDKLARLAVSKTTEELAAIETFESIFDNDPDILRYWESRNAGLAGDFAIQNN